MSRMTKVLALGMTLLLVPALTSVFAQRGQGRALRLRQAGKMQQMRYQRLEQELGLSAEQSEKLRQLRKKVGILGIETRSQLQIRQLELRELMTAKTVDRAAVDKKVQEIANLRGTQYRNRIEMRLGMQGILTPEQQVKIQEMRGKAVKQLVEKRRDAAKAKDRVGKKARKNAPAAPNPPDKPII
jgi:Spy/CpxP family protein refolding chaperone